MKKNQPRQRKSKKNRVGRKMVSSEASNATLDLGVNKWSWFFSTWRGV